MFFPVKKLALKMDFALCNSMTSPCPQSDQWEPIAPFPADQSEGFALFRLDGQGRQQSLTSEMKLPAESDTESIADYADGNDGGEA